MIRAAAVDALNRALAMGHAGRPLPRVTEGRARLAIAAAERLATACRHAANAIAAERNRREGDEPGVDMVDVRTELLIALEIFERLPNGNTIKR